MASSNFDSTVIVTNIHLSHMLVISGALIDSFDL